jgi:hypothetical protein
MYISKSNIINKEAWVLFSMMNPSLGSFTLSPSDIMASTLRLHPTVSFLALQLNNIYKN